MKKLALVPILVLVFAACADPVQPVGPREALAEGGPKMPGVLDVTPWVPDEPGFSLTR